jgi:hypothetical protein
VNLNNSSPTPTTPASKPYKTSRRQHPQTTPYGKRPRKPSRPQILPNYFGQHEEHGPEIFADHLTSIFQPHPSENPPGEKEALTLQLEISLTNSNPRSAGSFDQKFEPSSTTSNLKVPQATTSSRAKFFRNYLPLA